MWYGDICQEQILLRTPPLQILSIPTPLSVPDVWNIQVIWARESHGAGGWRCQAMPVLVAHLSLMTERQWQSVGGIADRCQAFCRHSSCKGTIEFQDSTCVGHESVLVFPSYKVLPSPVQATAESAISSLSSCIQLAFVCLLSTLNRQLT